MVRIHPPQYVKSGRVTTWERGRVAFMPLLLPSRTVARALGEKSTTVDECIRNFVCGGKSTPLTSCVVRSHEGDTLSE